MSQFIRRGTAPPSVVAQIKEIDTTLEVFEVMDFYDDGRSGWIVCSQGENHAARKRLLETISREVPPDSPLEAEEIAARLEWLQFYADGWRPLGDAYEAPDGRMVEDVRERDFNWRNDLKGSFDRKMDESDLDYGLAERQKFVTDAVMALHRDAYRYAVKKARSFLQRTPIGRA